MSLTTRALLAIGLVVGAGICALTGQEAPAEVYLVSDVNAWVADRGGMPGFGARRVMRLGPPLLQTLSIAELRAVLAHEFGHFFAGDTSKSTP